ncbi:11066_t:CDS:10 [Diversispora eburnea]|uniref:Autophagy-related protein 17 n=1 Tax=Diversispora eburnea TaxID=1213867 RepID=A0A9N9FJH8_9GLOM|nr:11066_t:CDS:10 [Diversispora eburnea]
MCNFYSFKRLFLEKIKKEFWKKIEIIPLQLGGKLCSKAENVMKECRSDVENIEKLYPKLRFLWSELECQVQAIEKLGEFAAKQNGILLQFYDQELSTIIEKLDSTLDGLHVKYVDSTIRENAIVIEQLNRGNNSNTLGVELGLDFDIKDNNNKLKDISEKVSLYDYVEEQGIQELKLKTQEEVMAIQRHYNTSSKIIENINNELKKLDEILMSNNISLEESGVDFSHEKYSILEQETQNMAETLESLARHYDQVTAALKAFQSHSNAKSMLDISVLEKDTDIIPTIVQELQEGLQFIDSTHFEKDSAMVDRLLDELLNLNLWYEEFSKAYDHMIIEIDRRHKVKEQHEKMAEEYLNKLEGLYIEEMQQRDSFFGNYGRYLPIDLYGTRLPVLSPKALSEAQENLQKYKERISKS